MGEALVVVNPAAGRGRAGRRWPEIEPAIRRFLPDAAVVFTEGPGDATEFARGGLARGARHIVAVGGDGTVNEALNGLVEADEVHPEAVLSPIPAGTANELCRALGLLATPDGPYRVLGREGRRRMIDMVRVECVGLDGRPVCRYGYLTAVFGAAAEISYRTSTSRYLKKLGGRFSYFAETLIVTLTYKHRPVRIAIDGGPRQSFTLYAGLCCNAENGGGGMKLAPGASLDDGVLDLVLFHDIKRRDILLQKPSWLFEGRHVEHPKVSVHRGQRFYVESEVDTLVDLDGETIGRLPATITVLPKALPVKA
ncbi:diacylglycerol/lipid kinase family protein [Desertibaculum subflavum]|uniref:diacylglycerol/lipid kinase family protein n=1 Tax=Desertibaculum subflavum TaxID=2268458 RepID=UPI000E66A181